MKLKGMEPRLAQEYGYGWRLSFHVEAESLAAAKQLVDDLRVGYLQADLDKWRERRSLDANAYFHVLCDKIAKAVNAGNDETKARLVLEYGVQKHDEDGGPTWFVIPQGDDPHRRSKYPKWFALVDVRGKPCDAYIEYQETHLMDTAEMSQLIDGTISEAKELGIETLPPAEIERMMQLYEKQADKGDGDSKNGQGGGVGT